MNSENKNNLLTKIIDTVFDMRELMIIVVVLIITVYMSLKSPYFLNSSNIIGIFLGLSVRATVAVGMMILFVSGGLDLSVGSTLAWAGVATALLLKAGIPVPLAIIIGLFAAGSVGLVNGLIVAKLNLNPFITTLGTMSIVRGLLLIASKGSSVINLPRSFELIGQGKLWGVQYPIIICIVLVIIGDIALRKLRFFRQNYYIGGNEEAARLTGIKVDKIKIFNYVLVAVMAGLAGILITARYGAASVTVGSGLELEVITAVIIGELV